MALYQVLQNARNKSDWFEVDAKTGNWVIDQLQRFDQIRPVKAMLFADVAGFSKIKAWQLSAFLSSSGDYLRELFASGVGTKAV